MNYASSEAAPGAEQLGRDYPGYIMPAASVRHTAPLLRVLRLLHTAVHLVRGAAIAGLLFPFMSRSQRALRIGRWSAQLLAILAVRLHVHGVPPRPDGTPRLLVANHVSWLDIFAINAIAPARFVAKSEVRCWPLIGWLCDRTGTLFIERARRRDAARLCREMQEAMLAGDLVALFPEATSSDGSRVLEFHSALLQPALLPGAVLLPVAIRYTGADGMLCTAAAYEGDKSIWDTLLQMVAQHTIDAHVHFLPPLGGGMRRSALAQSAHAVIDRALSPPPRCNRTARQADPPAAAR